tara:strand:- start:132 stop:740 length:609 start_codon:yes stop_codon:yes gene_type:complete
MTINNLAVQTSFLLDFIDSNQLSVFKAQVQTVNIPSVSMQTATIATTPRLISNVAGSGMEFDQLQVQYIVDEDYKSYIQLFKWMISINNPVGDATLPSGGGKPSTAILHLLNNNRTDNGTYLQFYNVYPSNLGSIDLAQNISTSDNVIGTLTLDFTYFDIFVDGEKITPNPLDSNAGGTNPNNRPLGGHPALSKYNGNPNNN